MAQFYQPDLGANPDDPFARDADNKLVRRAFWLDMSDRSVVLAMTQASVGHFDRALETLTPLVNRPWRYPSVYPQAADCFLLYEPW